MPPSRVQGLTSSALVPLAPANGDEALLKSKGTADADVMARANMSQRTYVMHYMRQIRRVAVLDGT